MPQPQPQPLDPERLDALAREDDVDEGMDFFLHSALSDIRRLINEDEDWGSGVVELMREGGRMLATIRRTKSMFNYEDRKGSYDWFLKFYDSFQDISVRPSPGGVVDIYAFGECLKSFQIIGCRKNWPALIRWIWEYGNQVETRKSKQKDQKRSRRQRRRVEKPLLHQVLRSARFKPQRERRSPTKDTAAIPDKTNAVMSNVDVTRTQCDTAATANSGGPGTNDEQKILNAAIGDLDTSMLEDDKHGS